MADIRIIKTVCALSETMEGWQKELNIVSIDGGPFQYDIREWRLDHFDYRDGISLDEKEATELMINLRKAFGIKDSDPDIEQGKMSIAEQAKQSETIETIEAVNQAETAETPGAAQKPDAANVLKEKGISFIDKREAGGALWVVGGHELDELMTEMKGLGFKFVFSEKGGKVSKGQAAWFCRKEKEA